MICISLSITITPQFSLVIPSAHSLPVAPTSTSPHVTLGSWNLCKTAST